MRIIAYGISFSPDVIFNFSNAVLISLSISSSCILTKINKKTIFRITYSNKAIKLKPTYHYFYCKLIKVITLTSAVNFGNPRGYLHHKMQK